MTDRTNKAGLQTAVRAERINPRVKSVFEDVIDTVYVDERDSKRLSWEFFDDFKKTDMGKQILKSESKQVKRGRRD